jgi:hypothetical protein
MTEMGTVLSFVLLGSVLALIDLEAVFPDNRIGPDWQSFIRGEDAALQWVLAHDK